MTCFHPLTAYRSLAADPVTGRHGIVFNPTKALIEGSSFKVPCGQCSGCRAGRAKEWAIRCGHEAEMHGRNCFVTLTYDNENVPQDYSVRKRDWQLLMMRVRKHYGSGIRFFGCGEYGDTSLRPHYHGLLFGLDFEDKRLWATRNGYQVFKSEQLEKLWPFGMCEIGSVTPESAGYVARYCLKKFTGKAADDHYSRVSPIDGAVHRVEPEFALMSRRPGLGTTWFEKFASDAFPSDFLIVDGRKVRPPGFYLRKLNGVDSVDVSAVPEGRFFRSLAAPEAVQIKRSRKRFSVQPAQRANSTKARLSVREEVFQSRMKRLVRPL